MKHRTEMPRPCPDLPPLRPWQTACIQQALATLSASHPHFLCQATPGAGKMLMAMLARELLERGEIDHVLYLGPTSAVVSRAAETLAQATGRAMHGRLGASGAAFTYHALRHQLDDLMRLCSQARVLLIWDESHHASGHAGALSHANQWGMALMALERQVRFTLALSGTPWRTDGSCLPLLRYLEIPASDEASDTGQTPGPAQRQLQPDFVYSLQQAIRDGVCRFPLVQLVDNRSIKLTHYHSRSGRRKTQRFASIPHLLRHPAIHYGSLLRHHDPMLHLLRLGCEKLATLRQLDTNAGGLVVASDIAHAEEIAQALEDRQQTVSLITSQTPSAHERLNAFREATTQWIVAVGMVSEGVDIPRLRVCCYLSHIRTEQHFRQVLGRIIRRQGAGDAECFLYALNEPHLRRYARRIAEDLPDDLARITSPATDDATAAFPPSVATPSTPSVPATANSDASAQESNPISDAGQAAQGTWLSLGREMSRTEDVDADLAFSMEFFERLMALRLPPS